MKVVDFKFSGSRDCPHCIGNSCSLDDTITCDEDGLDVPEICPLPDEE
jgi:hypothetical protein